MSTATDPNAKWLDHPHPKGVFRRKVLCTLCNGRRYRVPFTGQPGPIMLCAVPPDDVCQLQTYRHDPVAMADAKR